jgi:glyoxylase-like metal-dependent hydrolase (beta-lactamase superfamily II)
VLGYRPLTKTRFKKENTVRIRNWFVTAVLVFAGCATAPPEKAIINDAATALGGADKIQAVNTLTITGSGENLNLGQNSSPDAPTPVLKVSEYKRSIDFAGNRSRLEQVRTATVGNTAPAKQILCLDGDVAVNVNAAGVATRASGQVATDRRVEMYHHPIGALRAALAQGAVVANPRKDGNTDVVDITTSDGAKLTLYVDSQTKLPSKVSTISDNIGGPLGDMVVETSFANYADTAGLKLPNRLTTKNDKYTVADIEVSANAVNGNTGDLSAPADVKSAAAPPAAAPAMITVEEVGKGLWYLTGQSHHSVLAEFADHLVLIETPQHEVRSAAVIAKAKELRPNKPIKYVINTHHHFDHSGGIRAAIAEGATIITHEGNKAFIEAMASRPHTLTPDALSKSPKSAVVETVSDKRVLKDSTRTLEIYHVAGSVHSDTMLMVYFPAERLIVEADLYNPPAPPAANAPPPPPNAPPPVFPFAANFVENVHKLGLKVDRIMPIHGRIVPFKDAEAAGKTASSD